MFGTEVYVLCLHLKHFDVHAITKVQQQIRQRSLSIEREKIFQNFVVKFQEPTF